MNDKATVNEQAIQLFEPDPNTIYTLELAERFTRVPRRLIAIYYKHGLVSTIADPIECGFLFNEKGIRALRRVEYLRSACGINLAGLKMIVALINETERLRRQSRFLRT